MDKALSFLDLKPRKQKPKWTTAEVVFIGGENYPLISVEAEVHIRFVPGGFETKFKEKFAVPSELLLGSSSSKTYVFDIEIRLPGLTMSMAKMYPNTFPRVIGAGEMVSISG